MQRSPKQPNEERNDVLPFIPGNKPAPEGVPKVKVVLGGQEFQVRPVRPYNGFRVTMMLGKYLRECKPALDALFSWVRRRREAREGGEEAESPVEVYAEIWDILEPNLESLSEDLFIWLELASGIDKEFLKTEPTLKELAELGKTVYEINDFSGVMEVLTRR